MSSITRPCCFFSCYQTTSRYLVAKMPTTANFPLNADTLPIHGIFQPIVAKMLAFVFGVLQTDSCTPARIKAPPLTRCSHRENFGQPPMHDRVSQRPEGHRSHFSLRIPSLPYCMATTPLFCTHCKDGINNEHRALSPSWFCP